MESLVALMQESLSMGKSVNITPTGYSMLPMLRPGKDTVTLSPVTGKLKMYDIALFRRDDGRYVLHRVVKSGDTYTFRGDHQYVNEPGIRDDQIIAVATAFCREEKNCAMDSVAYWLYCRIWHYTRFVRKVLYRPLRWIYHKCK